MNLIPTLKARLEFDEKESAADADVWHFRSELENHAFTRGEQNGFARLAPIHAALIEIVELFELECKSNVCICKLNPYVGVPVPCETCRMNTALKNLKHVLEDTSNG